MRAANLLIPRPELCKAINKCRSQSREPGPEEWSLNSKGTWQRDENRLEEPELDMGTRELRRGRGDEGWKSPGRQGVFYGDFSLARGYDGIMKLTGPHSNRGSTNTPMTDSKQQHDRSLSIENQQADLR